ncbi:MAG: hypothetical protein SYC29_07235 [Planctomycetota bacterium]|nr:hypothetical protein [Planctomycetota bacterium]
MRAITSPRAQRALAEFCEEWAKAEDGELSALDESHPDAPPRSIDVWVLVDIDGAPVPFDGTHGSEIELHLTRAGALNALAEALRDGGREINIRRGRLDLLSAREASADASAETQHLAGSPAMLRALVDELSWVPGGEVEELRSEDRPLYGLLRLIAALDGDVHFRRVDDGTFAEDGAQSQRVSAFSAKVLEDLIAHGWLDRSADGVYHATDQTREAITADRARRRSSRIDD